MAKQPFEESERQRTKIKQAMAWLQEAMAGRECLAAELERQGLVLGFSHGTLYEARHRLRIRAEKRREGWYWLPKSRAKSREESG